MFTVNVLWQHGRAIEEDIQPCSQTVTLLGNLRFNLVEKRKNLLQLDARSVFKC